MDPSLLVDLATLGYTDKLTVLAEYLASSKEPGDANTELIGDASWVNDSHDGHKMAVDLGGKGSVRVPAVHFQSDDFSFGVWVKPKGLQNRAMHVYSDWTRPWSFYLQLKPSTTHPAYILSAELRREGTGGGFFEREELVKVEGGIHVQPDEWTFIALSWSGRDGIATLYVNERESCTAERFPHADDERFPQDNDHDTHDVGVKRDSESAHFVGRISGLVIASGVASTAVDLITLGMRGSRGLSVQAKYLVDQNASGDAKTKLLGGATWVRMAEKSKTHVSLKDKGYVDVAAVHFQNSDFAFGIWIKPTDPNEKRMFVFSDWSPPVSFSIELRASVNESNCWDLCGWFRRNNPETGWGPSLMLDFQAMAGGITIKPNEWTFVAFSWNAQSGHGSFFVNGRTVQTVPRSVSAGTETSMQCNEHEYHQVGVKKDNLWLHFVGNVKELTIAKGHLELY